MRATLRTMPVGQSDYVTPEALEGLVGATPVVNYPDGPPGTATVLAARVEDGWVVVDVELDRDVDTGVLAALSTLPGAP